MQFATLYSRRTDGSVQEWSIEVQGNAYRVTSGMQDGQKVTAKWTTCAGKNIGRANETTPEQQAIAEARSKWQQKKDNKYSETIDSIEDERPFQPMLAKNFEDAKGLFDENGKALQFILSQPKLDGIRCIATAKGLFSRNGKQFVACPHIEKALAPLFEAIPDLILDGEFYNPDLNEDFNKICSCVKRTKPSAEDIEEAKQIQYHVYDIPSCPKSFSERGRRVLDLLTGWHEPEIRVVKTSFVGSLEQLDELYGEYITRGYEGQMVRLNKPYENKRSATLLKRKEFKDSEHLILDVIEGTGNRSGTAGYCVIQVNGATQRSNIKGNREYVAEILANKNKYIGKLATVRYFNVTPDGFLRFPYIVAIDRESVEG